jgi:type IV secretion system protein VirB3
MNDFLIHPVFGALTRPVMTAGVSLDYHMMNLIVSSCAFIGMGNLLYGLLFVPVHAVGLAVFHYDAHFFSIARKRWFKLPNQPNASLWRARSYEPF